MRAFLFAASFILLSCQSAEKRAERELEGKLISFAKLESRIEKRCLVETTLSAPTIAKYQQSYPDQAQAISTSKNFIWEIAGVRCEFRSVSDEENEWEKNHLKILKGAFCTLLMGFQIQSPMSGVEWLKLEKTYQEGAFVWSKPSPGLEQLKMTLSPLSLWVLSEQGSEFEARYTEADSFPKIIEVKRQSSPSGLMVSGIKDQVFTEGRVEKVFPREIESLEISILDERFNEFQFYAQARILRCE